MAGKKAVTKQPAADQRIVAIREETADLVLKKVQAFQEGGDLHLPANYSAANALKSAWLVLQRTLDKNKQPVLTTCTKASIANTMLDMVIQGLNPVKKQCYFIAYGKELTLFRSYLGTKALVLRLHPEITALFAEPVYKGDKLVYSINRGRRVIEEHQQALENIDDSQIIAGYAIALGQDNHVFRSEIMTMAQIKNAWRQSSTNPITDKGTIRAGTTHAKFTGEMVKRTVANRLAKHLVGESSDADLVLESVARTNEESIKAEADQEIEEQANLGDVIEIEKDPEPIVEEQTEDPEPISEEEKAEILAAEAAEAEAKAGPGF